MKKFNRNAQIIIDKKSPSPSSTTLKLYGFPLRCVIVFGSERNSRLLNRYQFHTQTTTAD